MKTATAFKSLEISTRSEYVIRSVTYYAAVNDACGWSCANGDILKRILALIKIRTAPIHSIEMERHPMDISLRLFS
ncbi:hypothetical protein B0H16DRAFT_1540830 [Mycena metata]|uniref:Uncharacterized protein n=1 Tax=Mycena metata TaxID=1033252 RepID=A0AAD7J2P4_9AGAR|nr:hypothetical protein B0H16DRAFT_1540830 [Mycena metata]